VSLLRLHRNPAADQWVATPGPGWGVVGGCVREPKAETSGVATLWPDLAGTSKSVAVRGCGIPSCPSTTVSSSHENAARDVRQGGQKISARP